MTPPRLLRARALWSHILFSALLVGGLSYWVLDKWYPGALFTIQGATSPLLMVIVADLLIGPFLTFVVFRPERKGRRELALDMALILVLQLGAFGYGAWVLSVQRPAYLAFLYDRFFVITAQDVLGAPADTVEAIPRWSNGPRPVFVKLSFGAEMEAATSVYGFDQPPPMVLLPGAYAPLSDGKHMYRRIAELPESKGALADGVIEVPVIGRAGRGVAQVDVERGELIVVK